MKSNLKANSMKKTTALKAVKNTKPARPTKESLNISYKGVSPACNFNKKLNQWITNYRATATVNSIKEHLGTFGTPELAAKAYNKRMKQAFGMKEAKAKGRWNNV